MQASQAPSSPQFLGKHFIDDNNNTVHLEEAKQHTPTNTQQHINKQQAHTNQLTHITIDTQRNPHAQTHLHTNQNFTQTQNLSNIHAHQNALTHPATNPPASINHPLEAHKHSFFNPLTNAPANVHAHPSINSLIDPSSYPSTGPPAYPPTDLSGMSAQTEVPEFQVYQAKFQYDPSAVSPNDNPESELNFKLGDYLFIYGQADEDGFFWGETMDGKRGYVPSNFVQRVPEETLLAIKSSMVVDRILSPPRVVQSAIDHTSVCPQKQATTATTLKQQQQLLQQQISQQISNYNFKEENSTLDPEKVNFELAVCELHDPKEAPPPRDLRVERQLANSVMVAWSPPLLASNHGSKEEEEANFLLKSYSIYVDGHLRCVVDGHDRCKALLEKIDLSKVHRVSVRCNYLNRLESSDSQCTMLLGIGLNFSPSDFRVTNVTSSSVEVTWVPANSNLEHVIMVDSRCKAIIRPSHYRCIITGLTADTRHSVSIQPRVDPECPGSTKICLTFKTLPSEIPDAPVELQVEAGPRKGTLLVLWSPVKPIGRPPNCTITGYCVYVDGKKVKELHSPSGDHALLESEDLLETPKPHHLTIRSKTPSHESADSIAFIFTSKLLNELNLKELTTGVMRQNTPYAKKDPTRLNQFEARFSAQKLSPLEKKLLQDGKNAAEQGVEIKENVSDSSYEAEDGSKLRGVMGHQGFKRTQRQLNPDLRRTSRSKEVLRRPGGVRGRYFLALFDYDPVTMSPNPDALNEELPFKEGQIIKVYGGKDADGFYFGELSNGFKGLVPSNMITEIDDNHPLQQPQRARQGGQRPLNRFNRSASPDLMTQSYNTDGQTYGPRQMVVTQDFRPLIHPPNRDAGLAVKQGDVVTVHGAPDFNGYVRAEKGGMSGLVPVDFLRNMNDQNFNPNFNQMPNQVRTRHESYSSNINPAFGLFQKSGQQEMGQQQLGQQSQVGQLSQMGQQTQLSQQPQLGQMQQLGQQLGQQPQLGQMQLVGQPQMGQQTHLGQTHLGQQQQIGQQSQLGQQPQLGQQRPLLNNQRQQTPQVRPQQSSSSTVGNFFNNLLGNKNNNNNNNQQNSLQNKFNPPQGGILNQFNNNILNRPQQQQPFQQNMQPYRQNQPFQQQSTFPNQQLPQQTLPQQQSGLIQQQNMMPQQQNIQGMLPQSLINQQQQPLLQQQGILPQQQQQNLQQMLPQQQQQMLQQQHQQQQILSQQPEQQQILPQQQQFNNMLTNSLR